MGQLNIELLKKVRRKIKAEPYAYNQGDTARPSHLGPCGTACCIGGWADVFSAPTVAEKHRRMGGDIDLNRAARALGLSGSNFYAELCTERAVLFDGDPSRSWPEPFRDQWRRARTYAQRSNVAGRIPYSHYRNREGAGMNIEIIIAAIIFFFQINKRLKQHPEWN